eukprot:7094416-Prymnesium_polylepis.1
MKAVLLAIIALVASVSAFSQATYAKRHSGVCDDGWEYLDDPEECKKAAIAVGTKCEDCDHPQSRADRPKGCRAWIGEYCCAHWNTDMNGKLDPAEKFPDHVVSWAAVCKKASHEEL